MRSMSGMFGFTWSDWLVGFHTGAYLSLAVWPADKEPRRLISTSADTQSMGCRSWVTHSSVPLTSKSSPPTDCLIDCGCAWLSRLLLGISRKNTHLVFKSYVPSLRKRIRATCEFIVSLKSEFWHSSQIHEIKVRIPWIKNSDFNLTG